MVARIVSLFLAFSHSFPAAAKAHTDPELNRVKPLATYAVLFNATDQSPICAADLGGKPHMVPKEVVVPPAALDLDLALPLCNLEQENLISAVAHDGSDASRLAVIQAAGIGICAFSFISSTALVLGANLSHQEHLVLNATGFALGVGTATGAAQSVNLATRMGFGAVGFLCSGAGVYVAYMFVPRFYRR